MGENEKSAASFSNAATAVTGTEDDISPETAFLLKCEEWYDNNPAPKFVPKVS